MNLSAYLPQDRRRALARGENLPDPSSGAVLFADISGFTPLAQTLRRSLGPRRGAEELSRALDVVYTALIGEVERYGGSVTNFAGDAIFCWFDDGGGTAVGRRVVACAVALQAAMARLRTMPQPDGSPLALGLKTAVVVGNGRRFVVGDPDHYRLDVLAGRIVARAATAEQLTQPGEIIVDETAVYAFTDTLTVAEWRVDEATGERFAIVQPAAVILPPPVETQDFASLPAHALRHWLHPGIYERTQDSHLPLLTEFRPCTALFFRFGGIDYDSPAAAAQLDAVVRLIQQVAVRYDGLLIDLIIGEKGSYAYLNFGALTVHENNPRRALKAALSLAESANEFGFLEPAQIGLTQTIMRVGPYGSPTRRHYGALGEGAARAARLMQAAAPGQILADEAVWRAADDQFWAIPQPPLTLKGTARPVLAYAITGERPTRRARLLQPDYPLPLVGRQAELAAIEEKLTLAQAGQSQIVAVIGEAGIGKSRLLAEAIRLAQRRGFTAYEGACQSDGWDTPYHPWRTVWRALFGLEESAPPAEQVGWLTAVLRERLPYRLNSLPLLGWLLGLPIQENEFTIHLTPPYRQSVLHALLEEFLRQTARQAPLLIALEDLHWLDSPSHDLLVALAQATAAYPVCFLLAYRPPDPPRLQAPRLEKQDNFTPLSLTELSWAEAAQLARAKLTLSYPDSGGALDTGLMDDLLARAQGNPFFLEELLNYLRDQGIEPGDMAHGLPLELPESLHALILSRIDQLPARQKMVVRAASVIGRRFPVRWLTGYWPELGDPARVQAALAQLDVLDLILPETAEPESAYLFKHIITQEVAYESLSFAARAELHERLAAYLESAYAEAVPLETLAFHYGRSANQPKQREYLRRAGEAAQKNFANAAALTLYGDLLSLLGEDAEKFAIHFQRGQVLELLGQWAEAEGDYRAALEFAPQNSAEKARAQFALGKLNRLRGEYETALDWLTQARETQLAANDQAGLTETLIETGAVLWRQGLFTEAVEWCGQGLAQARAMDDRANAAQALHISGNVALHQGDYAAAAAWYEEGLSLRRELGNKQGIAALLNNLGILAMYQGDFAAARDLYEESLALSREMGDKWGVSFSLNNLAVVAFNQGDYAAGKPLIEENLGLYRQMGDKSGIASSLNNLGLIASYQGDYTRARALLEESLNLRREIGDKQGVSDSLGNLGGVALTQGDYATAHSLYEEGLSLCREMNDKQGIASAQLGWGLVCLADNQPDALDHILDSLRLLVEIGEPTSQTSSLVGLAGLALREGYARESAQWLGAVDAALSTLGAALDHELSAFHGQTLATAKARLGAVAFQQAWDEGAQWTLAEAVAYALAWPPGSATA